MKNLTKKDLNKISKIKPAEFVEQYCGTKLFSWQKEWINSLPKVTHYRQSRWNGKRLTQFYYLCNHLSKMKDNDMIMLWKGNGSKLMNKDEFANYLMTEYWL